MKALSFFIFLLLSPPVQAALGSTISDWPSDIYDRLRTDLGNEIDQAGANLQESLFEGLSDISLIETHFGAGDASLDVQRRVFKNYDFLNSYTVIDFMRLPLEWPLALGERVAVGASAFQFQLGLTLTPEIYHVRQVLPADLEGLQDEAGLRDLLDEEVAILESHDESESSLREILPWNSQNPLSRARYQNFWNLFTGPLKLPLSGEAFRHNLKAGEIMSYALKGRIQVGATVGWSAINIPGQSEITPALALSTYLDGTHHISIMKEDQDHALVKLTRSHTRTLSAGLLARHPDHVLFEGVVVLGARVGEIDAEVIPFSFSLARSQLNSFDVTYRYDLSTAEGESAYEQAVLGRFSKSDEFAQTGHGVQKVATRTQRGHSRARSKRMALSFFAQHSHTVSESSAIAEVTFENGEVIKLHRASTSNVRIRDNILGHKEVKSYLFKATLDEELYSRGDQGLVLRLEGRIEDAKTRSSELYRYMEEMETLAGQPQFFPRPPKYLPCEVDQCEERQEASYKDTSFYFRLGLTRAQIEKFIATDKESMWQLLEVAFDVKPGSWSSLWRRSLYGTIRAPLLGANLPLGLLNLHLKPGSKLLRAKAFRSDWLRLQELYFEKNNQEQLVQKLSSLFSARYFSYELARVLRVVLQEESLSYYLAGNAPRLFGHLSRTGVELDPLDARYEASLREINFDRIGGRDLVDQNLQVKELKVSKVDSDTYHITFELPHVPDYLFLSLERTSNWGPQRALTKFIAANRFGEFSKGANTIVVKRDATDSVAGELAQYLFEEEGHWMTFSLALGKASQWGALSSDRFKEN